MKRIGIVGHEAAKFTPETEDRARQIIRELLYEPCILVSGGCHLGGIDIWAEEEATALRRLKIIHKPKVLSWEGGYKQRNILIAKNSDIVHVIVVSTYPLDYRGMRFSYCYHCDSQDHIKSGACWTAKYAQKTFNKQTKWHVI